MSVFGIMAPNNHSNGVLISELGMASEQLPSRIHFLENPFRRIVSFSMSEADGVQ